MKYFSLLFVALFVSVIGCGNGVENGMSSQEPEWQEITFRTFPASKMSTLTDYVDTGFYLFEKKGGELVQNVTFEYARSTAGEKTTWHIPGATTFGQEGQHIQFNEYNFGVDTGRATLNGYFLIRAKDARGNILKVWTSFFVPKYLHKKSVHFYMDGGWEFVDPTYKLHVRGIEIDDSRYMHSGVQGLEVSEAGSYTFVIFHLHVLYYRDNVTDVKMTVTANDGTVSEHLSPSIGLSDLEGSETAKIIFKIENDPDFQKRFFTHSEVNIFIRTF